ncbi:hypothetical protein BD413DRAFT_606098 [Trametes elegans]|nr:hypothetical protein BD413DRAFT_606098 [Trametes elegans]
MSQQRGTCRLYRSPQGCRFGSRCKFSHDRAPSLTPQASVLRQSSPASGLGVRGSSRPPPSRPQDTPPRAPQSGVPHNVCQFFWTSGTCAKGFDCAFRHDKRPQLPGSPPNTDTNTSQDEEESTAIDFFTLEGMAVGSGYDVQGQHSLNPSEVHNYLKGFTADNYRLEHASRAQGFVRILASVHDGNKSWDLLEFIVKGNALLRIGDVLRFDPVKAHVGFSAGALSFQRGYLPIFQVRSSHRVVNQRIDHGCAVLRLGPGTEKHAVQKYKVVPSSHLYTVIANNHDAVFTTLKSCIAEMINARTWQDKTSTRTALDGHNSVDGVRVFRSLSVVLSQYLNRFKDATRSHSDVPQFVQDFARWFETWAEGVSAPHPTFDDPIVHAPLKHRELSITHIREDIERLVEIVERECGTVRRLRNELPKSSLTPSQRNQALAAQLASTYTPPGTLRDEGPRHDNDFERIADIRIAPTNGELFSPAQPYLPVFRHDAPHHLRMDSMERHLDIQFRLLREDLIFTTRSSMAAIQDDLTAIWTRRDKRAHKTTLEGVLSKNGGAYRTSGFDSVFFQVYTNVELFEQPPTATRRGITVTLVLDTPSVGDARHKEARKRYEYWEHSKRLQGSTLVVLVVVSNGTVKTYLGVISSFGKDIAESSKHKQDRIQLRVAFFDPEVELMALRGEPLPKSTSASASAFLVDNGIMFESVRPFLQKLQDVEPTDIPFARYIAPGGSIKDVEVLPPKYARVPGFQYRLQCLAQKGKVVHDLDVMNPAAVKRAREELRKNSVLDPSQAEAVVDTLTREVSLIQGYTAKEILRVMFASKIKPIVLIAFTNHALDHMLTSVLDANITHKIVRLGTRSSDERIAQYTLDKLEKVASASNLDRAFKRQYATMKKLEEQMAEVMASIRLPTLSRAKIDEFLTIYYCDHSESFSSPPFWISSLAKLMWNEEDENGEWQAMKKGGRNSEVVDAAVARTMYGFWRACKDLQYLQTAGSVHAKGGNAAATTSDVEPTASRVVLLSNPHAFFASLGYGGKTPNIPQQNRPLRDLHKHSNVWAMSAPERVRLMNYWEKEIRTNAYTTQHQRYNALREEYREACKDFDDMKDDSIGPQVLLVEEAGQVLEAHILASLVPSVRHLICIGDPQQLRPNLATFALSMDSEKGREFFKFDRSLMERLVDNGFQMSQINVQRRMRPTISHFIRTILYPRLEDHDVVSQYPPVQGMQHNVFFYSHLNKEGGAETDSVSKHNPFEVEMIRDLVLYFLRQGTYSGSGDIAVLCAYLGQLQKVRAALRNLKIAVAVDERDAAELARQGIDEEPPVEFEELLVAKHVRLGTVDIFQGQEAKIVIVSLVRNFGQFDTGSASIGFLKSSNRINVALSRAKHGLYILGNASNLRKNPTWSVILDEMEAAGQVGSGFPIACPRHPEQVSVITEPGELSRVAPAGGCLLPCGYRLNCGHICPSACHAAPDNHRTTKCLAPCNRTPCPRGHPCSRRCSDDCGRCEFPMRQVELPCGHIADKVSCHQLANLGAVKCAQRVQRKLPGCEHQANMHCHQDPATVKCRERCAGALQCCSKPCKALCSDCQKLNRDRTEAVTSTRMVARSRHVSHPCERALYCQHKCGLPCSQEHNCNTNEPCAPCMEACTWSCAHHSCPVLCGSICSRLPCDEPCTKLLRCGHACPSVCGELCRDQKCVVCLGKGSKADIVDFIMQRRLDEIDLKSTDVSDRLITLACGHIFTVETLDGHCHMADYYDVDPMGRYLSTKAPPVNYQSPPTCPTCRGPITALRYGRVTKRATLDILEQNVASTMSGDLDSCSPAVADYTRALVAFQALAKKLLPVVDTSEESAGKTGGASPPTQYNGPLPSTAFDLHAMQTVHGLDKQEARAWNQIMKEVFTTYRRVVRVATTRGAHVKAYESALTTLFRLEMESIANDPNRATDAPEYVALAIVDKKIGQPRPKADVRFQIEAYFLSLELRSLVAQIAQARIEGLPVTSNDLASAAHREAWVSFVTFLYTSCIADAIKAKVLADNSSATRQAARSALLAVRFEFERFRWDMRCMRAELFRTGNLNTAEFNKLSSKVKQHKQDMLTSLDALKKEYIRKRPSQNMAELKSERQWLDENCQRKVDVWSCVAHRGHFYNCENGHTFVITECGGAMEAARCPECNAPIGGTSHTLLSSNTRATEFEDLARRHGSVESPWQWARGA